MTAFTDLLSFSADDIKGPKLLPKGEYKCQIVAASIRKFWYAKSDSWGLAYVPKIRVIDYVPSGDPTLDERTLVELEHFGDWKSFEREFVYYSDKMPGATEKIPLAGIANDLNFCLTYTSPQWAERGEQHPQLKRFYCPAHETPNGKARGFVVETLGMEIPPGTMLPHIIAMTEGKMLYVTFDHQQDGEYDPQLVVTRTAAVS